MLQFSNGVRKEITRRCSGVTHWCTRAWALRFKSLKRVWLDGKSRGRWRTEHLKDFRNALHSCSLPQRSRIISTLLGWNLHMTGSAGAESGDTFFQSDPQLQLKTRTCTKETRRCIKSSKNSPAVTQTFGKSGGLCNVMIAVTQPCFTILPTGSK